EGFPAETKTVHKSAFRCKIRIPHLLQKFGLSNLKEEKILIQVDTEPQNVHYETQVTLLNNFDVLTQIRVVPLPTLLAQKLTAAFDRKRIMGRDFYDIMFLWPKTTPDFKYLKVKLGISTPPELRNYLLERSAGVNFSELSKDLL